MIRLPPTFLLGGSELPDSFLYPFYPLMADSITTPLLQSSDQTGGLQSPFENITTNSGRTYLNYEELFNEYLNNLPSWKKPFMMFKDDCFRLEERYLEQKHCLPNKYLRGFRYFLPKGHSKSVFIKRITRSYEEHFTRQSILKAITSSTEQISQQISQVQNILDTRLIDLKTNG